nr:MAG TPA: hypothetical protein [Caudoviricetes sp.]
MSEVQIFQQDTDHPTISGRELHAKLEIDTPYHKWFPRMCEYGFTEGADFNMDKNVRVQKEGDREVSREVTDHQLTIDMAKEICMLQRSEQGKAVRRYLLDIERQWNTPEAVMSRALRLADAKLAKLTGEMQQLRMENSDLIVQNRIMAPKADYFDELVDRGVNISIRETAKQLEVKEREFVKFLMTHKYIYRDKKGKLMPYAQHSDDGLFTVKECFNDKSGWGGIQTLVTPKGRETFRLLMDGMRG